MMVIVVRMYKILNLLQIVKLESKTTKFYKHDPDQIEEFDPKLKFQKLDLLMGNLFYKLQITYHL